MALAEAMPRTYIPDNEGAVTSKIPDGVRIEMPTEPWTCLTKAVEIQLNPDKPQVILRHEIQNDELIDVSFRHGR